MRNGIKSVGHAAKAVVITLMVALGCPSLFGQEQVPSYKPPAYQVLRQNEDWSGLAAQDKNGSSDAFDSIKYVPLNADGSVWASFGGQIRFRTEGWGNFNFGAPLTADDHDVYPLNRFLYHTDLHVGKNVRFFVQGKSAFVTDRDLNGGSRGLDEDKIDLQNAFIDLSYQLSDTTKFTFRTGRQELLFGKQRLVSPLDWSNTRRTFDGLSGTLKLDGWALTGFWTHPVPVRQTSFNRFDPSIGFYGVYAAGKLPTTKVGVDLYWLGLNKGAATYNGTSGSEQRQTVGARIGGKIPRSAFNYDLEAAYQFGSVGANNISAYMIGSRFGYSFAKVATSPQVYVAFDYGSGDDAAGGNVGTFNHLFPLGHAYLGYMDSVGRQNIVDLSSGASFKPIRKLLVKADWHNFWRANINDALYHAGGGVVRAGSAGISRKVGQELDLTFKFPLNRHLMTVLGYSRFFAGDFIQESGPSDNTNFGYLALQYTF